MNYKKVVNELVNKGADNIWKKTVILNDNKPIFSKQDFNIVEGSPKYYGVDKYGRITGGIAIISRNTLPFITEKELKYPRPYGWNENLEKVKGVFESCHIIAYNLSAQSTDEENLFIGTNDLNRSTMKKIENSVNTYVSENDIKVLYKVTMKYKGNDQIPIGILIEAQSLEDDFTICTFCYNIERYIKFNYYDGTIIYNHRYLIKSKDTLNNLRDMAIENKNDDENTENKIAQEKTDYILDTNKKICHYSKNCKKIQNIEPKYIQSTRTTRQVIADNGFTFCDKCKKEVE